MDNQLFTLSIWVIHPGSFFDLLTHQIYTNIIMYVYIIKYDDTL